MNRPRVASANDWAPPASPWRLWPLAVAAALVGGALAVAFAHPYDNPDSHAFVALARSLMAGRGLVYREPMLPGLDLYAFRSPGYAVFLAGLLPFGDVRVVLAAQGALAGITAVLWADLSARVAGLRAGVVTALAALALGLTWRLAGELMSETLYVTLVALALWLIFDLTERARGGRVPGAARVLALGGTLATAVLTRPSGFALVAACAWLAVTVPPARRSLAGALLVALVLWSPWPLRNAAVLGAPIPSLTCGGINAWNGSTGQRIDEGWRIAAANVSLGERGLDRMFWRLTFDAVRADPALAVSRLLHKAHDYAMPPAPRALEWPHTLLWGPALAAPFVIRRRGVAWRAMPGLAIAVWAAHAALTTLTVVGDRYRYPTDGIVMMLGALGIDGLLARFGGARGALAVGIAIGFGVMLAYTRHH